MTLPRAAAFSLIWIVAFAATAYGAEPGPRPIDFNRDIRPILSETCFQCHGPDAAKRKADLRLDTRDGLFKSVVVPRNAEESDLYTRLIAEDDDDRMPPRSLGKDLSAEQVALIKRWIDEGAEWRGHWAYLTPVRPNIPQVEGPAASRNDIDRLILSKLKERGFSPSPEADRITLIRRLSFDLTGLPPTPSEVDAFVNDKAPDAYESLVDRLLGSPHFGERMAMYWLDLVRYADTTGIHGDNHRDVSLYRDYVIKAFNENMPFDQFTIEQIAGDLLPNPSDSQRIGSGYNRMLMTTQEGGAQAKEYLAKYSADRVRNASTVWMGATLGCAECHDHKFDPFKTRDFYRFASYFADIQEVAVGAQEQTRMPTPEQATEAKRIDAKIAAIRKTLDTQTPELDRSLALWEEGLQAEKVAWDVVRPISTSSTNGTELKVQDDGSILATGPSPESDTYTLSFKIETSPATAIRLEVLPDDSLPGHGPGRAANGNFVLNELQVSANGAPLPLRKPSATHSQAGYDVVGSRDGQPNTGWAILDQTGRVNEAVFELESDPKVETFEVRLQQAYGSQHTLGHFRVSITSSARPIVAGGIGRGLPPEVAQVLEVPPGSRSDKQKASLTAYYRGIAPALETQRKSLADEQMRKDDLQNVMPQTLISIAVEPRDIRILPRGNWLDESGPIVTPAVPEFLRVGEQQGPRATRLDLARWFVSRENPLVARVFVNRLWKLAFGQGIVTTLDDFGSQGTWPTHPELLDWLAVEFMDRGWDTKGMLRLMLLSSTYRQSSNVTEALRQGDPYNHWLARQGRYRLEAEVVRDNALAISGLLSPTIGGPSVKPYQPVGYWFHLNFPKREYQSDHGEGLYRRGLYTYWCRTFLHPSLLAFDAPSREECKVERPRSNTPLQSLVLLNDTTYVEAARSLAEHIVREGGDDFSKKLVWAYRRALSRPPHADEARILEALYGKHLDHYKSDWKAADELVHTGERDVPFDLDVPELAAWTSISRAILNLHETITRN
ncbi:PSD1 and planctomycete cytochrome C domain-containing protein [Singulisphaera rosea]